MHLHRHYISEDMVEFLPNVYSIGGEQPGLLSNPGLTDRWSLIRPGLSWDLENTNIAGLCDEETLVVEKEEKEVFSTVESYLGNEALLREVGVKNVAEYSQPQLVATLLFGHSTDELGIPHLRSLSVASTVALALSQGFSAVDRDLLLEIVWLYRLVSRGSDLYHRQLSPRDLHNWGAGSAEAQAKALNFKRRSFESTATFFSRIAEDSLNRLALQSISLASIFLNPWKTAKIDVKSWTEKSLQSELRRFSHWEEVALLATGFDSNLDALALEVAEHASAPWLELDDHTLPMARGVYGFTRSHEEPLRSVDDNWSENPENLAQRFEPFWCELEGPVLRRLQSIDWATGPLDPHHCQKLVAGIYSVALRDLRGPFGFEGLSTGEGQLIRSDRDLEDLILPLPAADFINYYLPLSQTSVDQFVDAMGTSLRIWLTRCLHNFHNMNSCPDPIWALLAPFTYAEGMHLGNPEYGFRLGGPSLRVNGRLLGDDLAKAWFGRMRGNGGDYDHWYIRDIEEAGELDPVGMFYKYSDGYGSASRAAVLHAAKRLAATRRGEKYGCFALRLLSKERQFSTVYLWRLGEELIALFESPDKVEVFRSSLNLEVWEEMPGEPLDYVFDWPGDGLWEPLRLEEESHLVDRDSSVVKVLSSAMHPAMLPPGPGHDLSSLIVRLRDIFPLSNGSTGSGGPAETLDGSAVSLLHRFDAAQVGLHLHLEGLENMEDDQLTDLLDEGFDVINLEGQAYCVFPYSIWRYHDQLRMLQVGHSYDISRAIVWVPEEGLNEGLVARVIFQERRSSGEWRSVSPLNDAAGMLFPGLRDAISVAGIYWEGRLSDLRALVPLGMEVPEFSLHHLPAGESKSFAEIPPLEDLSSRDLDNLSHAVWALLSALSSTTGLESKVLLGTIVFLSATNTDENSLFARERDIKIYANEKVTIDSWLQTILGHHGAEIVDMFGGSIPGEIFFERYKSWSSSDGRFVAHALDFLNGLESEIKNVDEPAQA